MSDILHWLKQYSADTVLLLAIAGAILFLIKLIVERSVAGAIDRRGKALDLALSRRSAFEDKILTDRYTRIIDLAARLQRITTNLNRLRVKEKVPDGFKSGNDIVPLTEVYEDMEIYRIVLTERFHALLSQKAALALSMAESIEYEEDTQGEWQRLGAEWQQADRDLRNAVDEAFGLSKISAAW
jgi:hypothetical protein